MNEELMKSANGKNKHTFHCRYLTQTRYYCTCAHLSDAYIDGRLKSEIHTDCAYAMDSGKCKGIEMRREEIEKGESIYFVERDNVNITKIDKSSESYKIGWNKVGSSLSKSVSDDLHTKPREVFNPTVIKPKKDRTNITHADAINEAVKKEQQEKKKQEMIEKVKKLQLKGETLKETIIRLQKEKAYA